VGSSPEDLSKWQFEHFGAMECNIPHITVLIGTSVHPPDANCGLILKVYSIITV
jgi:hypothetical protein